ncbi:Gfo/Idh/MocA family protein [Thalassoglobus polymorphus]|uniref:Glucose--fructose oxidoreductase n=1 Tax=Thalassoglobus polymorphus TaxID=2527994 RepID=A0A517QQP3_9PLAN|nr:Gfo/Idh/MocA family oxidoreductase [Thalassoglobus polymorphus]QDT33915.1 Glucose--fructose oxidoreductase precursor [Thalassoglobus polymorphus]
MPVVSPEQEQIGKDNFSGAVHSVNSGDLSRRDVLKAIAAGGVGTSAALFGYGALKGERVKVAFIGTGDEGNILLNEHPPEYMEIVAIADLRPSNRERAFKGDGNDVRRGLVKKLGAKEAAKIKTYGSHKELLEHKDELGLEAVVIATPLVTHAPISIDCMNAGLHVLTEKLMARTVPQCKEMIRKARDKNLLLAVGHQRHYSVLYDNANNLIQNGLLGDIRHIRAQWHRNNSFPHSDSWQKGIPRPDQKIPAKDLEQFGFNDVNQLVNWRLYEQTGGGLMAELGSHQMDAASIFLGKVHPIAVSGFGGKNFYGIPNVGPKDKWDDDREIDDQIFVTFEFPGAQYDATDEVKKRDKCIVTYSSINTNKFEPYGELVYGTRGTMFMKTEKEAMLWKEDGRGSQGGGPDQRLWVISGSEGGEGGPVMEAYETTSGPKVADTGGADWASNVSRGYREEMEHFCYAIRNQGPNYWPDGKPMDPEKGGLRCNGVVAMADAIMALTANLAMDLQTRIEFKPEWFDPDSDAAPELEHGVKA